MTTRVSPSLGIDLTHMASPGLRPTRPNVETMSLCACGALPSVQRYGIALFCGFGGGASATCVFGVVEHPARSAAPVPAKAHSFIDATKRSPRIAVLLNSQTAGASQSIGKSGFTVNSAAGPEVAPGLPAGAGLLV